ncbi:MAG: hypothetical protein HPY69_20870 [Armatimonadetes bacterium]|nr:hypothetical protein [Armatimonadota bacterium]
MQNLEHVIHDYATTIADRMKTTAGSASTEEDVRQAVNASLNEFVKAAGLKLQVRNEVPVLKGRVDSKYGGVIIEYKNPRGSGRITEDPSAPGTRAVVKRLAERFRGFHQA